MKEEIMNIILKNKDISVIWREKDKVLMILTKHVLIRVYPERMDGKSTMITINSDKGKTSYEELSLGTTEDILSIQTTGYGVDDDYWGVLAKDGECE